MPATVEELRFEGAGGAPVAARLHLPARERASGAGVLLIGEPDEPAGAAAERAARAAALVAAGHAALSVELAPGEGGGPPPDRRALVDLDAGLERLAACADLDPERLAAWGSGRAGTRAFLLGCHSRRLAAAVCTHAPFVEPDLGPARPVQPLEMALNLGCPLLAVFAEDDPLAPPAQAEELRRVLSQFAREFDIVVRPRSEPGARAASDADPAGPELAFLAAHLES
jgi:dienelactone hydrolase